MAEQVTTNKPKYNTEYQRKKRLKNKKCVKCGRPAWGKPLITQELLCTRCIVAPLKEALQKEAEEKQKSQLKQNAPSVANQASSTA